jgi:uncharacterized protein
MKIFHLSIPVTDLKQSREFYESVLGAKTGRVTERWIDLWFFGMQLTLQQISPAASFDKPHDKLHFGGTLSWEEWENARDRFETLNIEFIGVPAIDAAKGQAKLYLEDPDGYVIELKAYRDIEATLQPQF